MDTHALYTMLDSLHERITRLECSVPSPAPSQTVRAVAARVDFDKVDGGWAERSKHYDGTHLAAIKHLRAKKLVDDYVSNHQNKLSSDLWPILREKVRGMGRGKDFTGFMEDVLTIASERFV